MARVSSPQEVFDAMPGRFLPEQAGDLRATIQFDLSGHGGGQWNAVIADRQLTVNPGVAPNPSVTFSAAAQDYVAMINGELHPMHAFMQGRIKVRGDLPLVMKMQNLFSFK
ncbi:MAG: SCP2 sterol-binding domain-containing protein [Anaerolineales bacterium]|nr:SCP2 sterol-binding domain-containing protein [Anaerolineales bacterium]